MFDYTEVVRKNGQRLIFCKFEDLIPEAFGCTLQELDAREAGSPNILDIVHSVKQRVIGNINYILKTGMKSEHVSFVTEVIET